MTSYKQYQGDREAFDQTPEKDVERPAPVPPVKKPDVDPNLTPNADNKRTLDAAEAVQLIKTGHEKVVEAIYKEGNPQKVWGYDQAGRQFTLEIGGSLKARSDEADGQPPQWPTEPGTKFMKYVAPKA